MKNLPRPAFPARALLMGAAAVLAWATASFGVQRSPRATLPGVSVNGQQVTAEMSSLPGRKETAWRFTWTHETGRSLYLLDAAFRRAPGEAFLPVLNQAGLADIFVPYHSGDPRYWDLTAFEFGLDPLTQADAGPSGRLLADSDGQEVAVLEMRDRGPIWKDESGVRRGRELVLWGALKAGNYFYLTQYSFLDDGTIAFRIGATGTNLPNRELETHMHSGLWRIDMALPDQNANTVMVSRHREPHRYPGDSKWPEELQAGDEMLLFNNGVEGGMEWVPQEFTMLTVQNTRKNAQGRPMGYDLMPLRSGTARHFGNQGEEATLKDFYVTRFDATELDYRLLPHYVKNRQSIKDTHVVLWYAASMHHEPRSEDGRFVRVSRDLPSAWEGTTHVMWGGFDLRPRNLFDQTPLYPNPR